MKTEPLTTRTAVLDRAFASTRAILAEVQLGQLEARTPCALWDVRALINHFVGTARWAAASVSGTEQAADEDYAAGDFLARYDASIQAALAAFGAERALERTLALPIGEFSGVALMNLAASDQFTHGWDLARALGHPTDLDPELASELLTWARTATPDALRGPEGVGLFGPAVPAPAGAGPASQLAAFLGRPV
jgi:uncharacterized protein (TIGR03086 family)